MANSRTITTNEELKYSKLLSSLFCSTSIIILSILCLLNNLSLDIYSVGILLKVVMPGSFCFWFLGNTIGKILDNHSNETPVKEVKLTDSNEAYSMPSMFADDTMQTDDGFGDL